jgi:hypothetical protein
MSYLQTVASIRTAANAVNDNRFDHGRRVDFSQGYDKKFPMIFLYPLDITNPDVSSDNFFDNTVVLLGFWDMDNPASSMIERETLIGRMDELATAFLEELRENTLIQVTGVSREPQYQHSQGHVSGMALRFTFQNFEPCP